MSVSDEEHSELLKALVNAVMIADGMLESCRHLTNALEWQTAPSPQQIQAARQHLERWRADLDTLKQRLASVTIEPPTRVQ
jgi:hypothetical protein